MRISYDKSVDAMKIKLNNHPYEKTQEVSEGVFVDLSPTGGIIAIEILGVSARDIDPYEVVCRYHPVPEQA